MPTVPFWAEPAVGPQVRRQVLDQIQDVAHLLRFRAATVRRKRLAAAGLIALGVTTVLTVAVPVALGPRVGADTVARTADALPTALAVFVALAVTSAVAVGGGRELLARDPASVHPIGAVTDHLGALLLAPMSAAWLLPAWWLVAAVTVATDGDPATHRVAAIALTAAWILAATTLGQLLAWSVEWLRRGPRGVLLVRLVLTVVLAVVAGAVWRGLVIEGPAGAVAAAISDGTTARAVALTAAVLTAAGGLLVIGAVPAAAAGRRTPRDEARLESGTHRARPDARSDLAALTRIDRASVWRSLPLRRGTYLLALAPGLFAAVAGVDWQTLVVLPGLVASGCVLLFGVNVWCLDGRGALWRESLPVAPATVFAARTRVVVELLLGAGAATLLLGALRAGTPRPVDVLTALLVLLAVTAQAVSAGMRWSAKAPYAVDLRSARATPAPPLTMIGYSVRLAFATTLTAMLLAGLATTGRATWVLLPAAVLITISIARTARSRRRWLDADARARVTATIAA